MTDYEQIFLSSGQEKQKLSIALKRIRRLCSFASLTAPTLEQFIQEASVSGQTEILTFLLRLKKDSFGFHDREFSL